MKKMMIIPSIILSGGLLVAGQAIGQFESQEQTLQRERSESRGAGISSPEGSLGSAQTDSGTLREDTDDNQRSGFVAGRDQQRFRDTAQPRFRDTPFRDTPQQRFRDTTQRQFRDDERQFDRGRLPQQQTPLQREFGVSPRFEDRGFETRQPTRGRIEDRPGGFSDTTREGESSVIGGSGRGQGQSGSGMQSGQGSSNGGFGGQGGFGGGAGGGSGSGGGSGGSGGQ